MAKANYFRVLAVLAAMVVAALMAVMASHAPVSAATATDTLKQPPFAPTDTSLFAPQVYSDAPPLAPAASGPTDEATLRGQLTSLLKERFGFKTKAQKKKVKSALALFDSASTKRMVPDPRLRAALVALKGTAGESAIAGVLNGTYSTVRFGITDPSRDAIAQVSPSSDGSPEIVFNERFQYQDFRLLASIMAHEALHRDFTVSDKEELIANAMDTLIYAQFLLENPDLATSGTELARANNTELMARINTRDANGNLRLFTSQGNIFPGDTSNVFVPYFAAYFEPLGNSTNGNAVLKGQVRNVVGPNTTLPATVNFDDQTVLLLDSKQVVFTPTQLVRLATILKLDTSPPSATEARRAQEEAEASDQPVPSWQEIFGAE